MIIGGGGNDFIQGGNGNDLIFGDNAFVAFQSSSPLRIETATSTLFSSLINPGGYPGDGDDSDTIYGNADDDIIFGGSGYDGMYHTYII